MLMLTASLRRALTKIYGPKKTTSKKVIAANTI